jgi:distribution and morphology protein 31
MSRTSGRIVHSPLRASLDRYSTIHAFFSRQSKIPHTTTKYRPFPVHTPYHTRGIHFTARLYLQNGKNSSNDDDKPLPNSQETSNANESTPVPPPHPPNIDNYSQFYRRLALAVPHLHRPTRDDFLKVASGFWERMRVRFKWFTIKSFRRFNADDISAFITWFVMSQTLWILVGT